jgi:hypothetical protein
MVSCYQRPRTARRSDKACVKSGEYTGCGACFGQISSVGHGIRSLPKPSRSPSSGLPKGLEGAGMIDSRIRHRSELVKVSASLSGRDRGWRHVVYPRLIAMCGAI